MTFYISILDGGAVSQLRIAGRVAEFATRAEAEAEVARLRAGAGSSARYAVVGDDENDPLLALVYGEFCSACQQHRPCSCDDLDGEVRS
jgi:hypothetical protein